ncbi:hypothetical protein AB6A40_000897 [Gnathostoma spinigerum]|uniref:leucine--tRNA ligase n=1 Tax=Gnathostoma spinigerum TaxID=75299 RepID=A0ABD6EBM5_9BILA
MFLRKILYSKRLDCQAFVFYSTNMPRPCLNWPVEDLSFASRLHDIESYWKKFTSEPSNPIESKNGKKYVLSMFPYPSGKLHIGHMRVYTISDVLARYYRLNGYKVIHPIGWDAFGLPAENAARNHGIQPEEWTRRNIDLMRQQLHQTGIQFDWEREICTCSPDYYRWTQWIFCRLFDHGFVRRSLSEVNWDPVDETVLADEQIDLNGRSWRSGAFAEKKKLKQWSIETPKYAKRLYNGLLKLEQWKEVADIQMNWIGPCDVWRFLLPIRSHDDKTTDESVDLRIRNPKKLVTAKALIVTDGHSLASADLCEPCRLPLTVTNAVYGRPLPILYVPTIRDTSCEEYFLNCRLADAENDFDRDLLAHFEIKCVTDHFEQLSDEDVTNIAEFGGFGGYETSRHLRDWVVSRQRKWGTPIPMLLSEDGRYAVPVSDDDLPVINSNENQRIVQCDRLPGGVGIRESDTLDTFFDSSWYYLRFLDHKNNRQLISKRKSELMPVDVYVGGIEHAAVHMFFARFISYFLHDIGITNTEEPFEHVVPQGVVRGLTYSRIDSGEFVHPEDVNREGNAVFDQRDGAKVAVTYEKMSKSKYNGVDPLDILSRDGVDIARLQLLGIAAPKSPINWGEADLKSLTKWLNRIAWIVNQYTVQRTLANSNKAIVVDDDVEKKYREKYNYFVRNISVLLEDLYLHNTAIARLQGFTNALRKVSEHHFAHSIQVERCIHALIIMLQVFAPFSAAEFWSVISTVPAINNEIRKRNCMVQEQNWPKIDKDADIDFILNICNVNCRRNVPQQTVKHMSVENLAALAMNQIYKDLFIELKLRGHVPVRFQSNFKEDFYVVLDAIFDSSFDEKILADALNATRKKKQKSKLTAESVN